MATEAEQPGDRAPGTGRAPPISQPHPSAPDLTSLHRKAQAAFALELPPDEAPRLVIPGLASSAIVATDARAFVFKAGTRAGLPFTTRLKEFEFESVMRVDLRECGSVHVVVIHAPLKIGVCSSYWADYRDDPWKARNAIPVALEIQTHLRVQELSQLLSEFQHRSVARRSLRSAEQRAAQSPAPDVLDRISNRRPDAPGATQIVPVPSPAAAGMAGPAREDCLRCGAELGAGWQFCPRCGAPASLRESERAPERRRRRR